MFGLVWKVWLYRRHSKRNQVIKITTTITTVLPLRDARSLSLLIYLPFLFSFVQLGLTTCLALPMASISCSLSFSGKCQSINSNKLSTHLGIVWISDKRYRAVSKIKNRRTHWANVVCKVVIEENKLKAMSNPVWVCWKAMI